MSSPQQSSALYSYQTASSVIPSQVLANTSLRGRTEHVPKPLDFKKAMDDFSTMFPELDRAVIETVLRSNNGVVQSTIDQLLLIQESTVKVQSQVPGFTGLSGYENSLGLEPIDEPPPAYSDVWADVDAPGPDVMFPLSLQNHSEALSSSHNSRGRYWNVPLLGHLPDDFLRLKVSEPSLLQATQAIHEDFMNDEELEQFLEDERLAMFLQNEEFVKELRRNPEFVSSLEADHQEAIEADSRASDINGELACSATNGGARPRAPISNDDLAFRQKLRHMGKSTRRKFGKIASKFTRGRKGSSRNTHTFYSTESTFNLLDEDYEDKQPRVTGLDHIHETTDEYDDDVGNEEHAEGQRSHRRVRQLPTTPNSGAPMEQCSRRDEPIVFYEEDNEFVYKKE